MCVRVATSKEQALESILVLICPLVLILRVLNVLKFQVSMLPGVTPLFIIISHMMQHALLR